MTKIRFRTLICIVAGVLLGVGMMTAVAAPEAKSSAIFGAPPSDILPPEKAFQVTVEEASPDHVLLDFLIAPRTYLYQKAFRFTTDDAHVGTPVFPTATVINDPFLGKTDIFREDVHVRLPISPAVTEPFLLTVAYQGCHDVGFCYPPQTVQLTIQPVVAHEPVNTSTPTATAASRPFDVLATHSGWALLAFLGFGILLSFTPCVLPMVPILSALILGEQQQHHPVKAFALAVSYVLGMALTYAALGAIVGSMGARIQVEWQNPWVLSLTAGLLLIFAGMLLHDGPQALLSRLSGAFHRLSHALPSGEYIGVMFMGVVASLVISPCVTPPLVGALTFITLEGNMWFGSLALFMLGLGMGLPLLAVTWLGTAILPRRGPWMEGVKHFLALLLVGLAIGLLMRFLPDFVGLILYGVLSIAVGLWLKPFRARHGMARAWQAIAWASLVIGTIWVVGGALGHGDWRAPLRSDHTLRAQQPLHFTVVNTPAALDKALSDARAAHQPAFVDFYADWCISCVHVEKTVFTRADVQALLASYALIKVDVTESTDETKALLTTWQLFGPPAYLFFDAQGQELKTGRINGEIAADDFVAYLQHIRPSSVNQTPSSKN